MPLLETLGGQAAGAAMGMMLGHYNDQRQIRQQQALQNLQIGGNKQMMDYAYQKQLQMWNATGYAAQLQQMKAAGLSPGLMYGMKGGGGITTGTPSGSVQGANAPIGGGEIPTAIGQGMQLELLKAQKENIQADTANKQAEATKKTGVDTELGKTQIQSLTQGIENQKAQQRFTEIQTSIEQIRERIQYITENSAIEMISSTAKKAMMEARMSEVHKEIDEATAQDKIKTIQVQLIKLGLENLLIGAQTQTEKGKPAVQTAEIQLMQTQRDQLIKAGVDRLWELEIRAGEASTHRTKVEHDNWVNDISNSMKIPIDMVEKLIQAVMVKDLIRPTIPRSQNNKYDPNFWKHRKTDVIK